jgi:glutaredoxin
MKGCPFCTDFKEMLTKEGIEFFDRDIDEYKKEYDMFSERRRKSLKVMVKNINHFYTLLTETIMNLLRQLTS